MITNLSVDCNESHRYLILVYTNSNVKMCFVKDSARLVVEQHWYAKKFKANHHQPSVFCLFTLPGITSNI